MEEFKETEPVPSSPSSLLEDVPQLERQDAVDTKDVEVVETGQPKKKRVLTEAQKENLRLGRATARKNRESKAKVKLDEMVDNYLKPYAEKETKEEEKTDPEPVVKEEVVKKAPVVEKKKRASKKSRPTGPYSTLEES